MNKKLFYIEFYDLDGSCSFLDDVMTFSISEDSFFLCDVNNNGFRFPMSLITNISIEVKK